MSLRDLIESDATAVFGRTDDYAETLTLYHYSATTLTTNQLLSLMGYPPLPDGDIDAADRRQLLGLYRFGDLGSTTEQVTGVFDQDNLDLLQGMNLDDERGRRVTEIAVFEIPATVTVGCDESPEKCDYFVRDDVRWNCIRILGRDDGMQSIALRRDSKITTKSARHR